MFGSGGRYETMRVLLTYTNGPLDATARVADEAEPAKGTSTTF